MILVDDGIATGYTMRAAVKTVRAGNPRKVVVAVPVAPRDVQDSMRGEVDEIVILEQPMLFGAIGAFYDQFSQVDDETVVELMRGSP